MNYDTVYTQKILKIVALLCITTMAACGTTAGQKAGEGAATGAIVGAIGGLVTGLVFGGNVADSAARGAVWGASTGAVAGAMSGAGKDQVKKGNQSIELEKLKGRIGDDAFNGMKALAHCKHEVALAYSRTAAKSKNKDHALAGQWLEVITHADKGEENKARTLFPQLIATDPKVSTKAQTEATMRDTMQKLMTIRKEHNLSTTCE